MKPSPIHVLVVEDHTLVREGFCSLLRNMAGVEIVAETGNGQESLAFASKHQPNLALLDITLPGLNGLEVAKRLNREFPDIQIIMLSMHANEDYVRQALRVGAKGYLLKDVGATELEAAINSVMQGRTYLSTQVEEPIIQEYIKPYPRHSAVTKSLTPRQEEVLQLMGEGHSTKGIAHLLKVSPKTIETHRMQLMERLQIYDVPGLVRYAIRTGLISPDL